jgi:hypothetical protein
MKKSSRFSSAKTEGHREPLAPAEYCFGNLESDDSDYMAMQFPDDKPPISKEPPKLKGKSARILMTESIEKSFDKVITEDNKGYKLLQKFGFNEDGLRWLTWKV